MKARVLCICSKIIQNILFSSCVREANQLVTKMCNYLAKVIEHELCYADPPPLWMGEDEADVGLRVTDVGDHEGESDDDSTINDNAAEVGVLQTFRHYGERKFELF